MADDGGAWFRWKHYHPNAAEDPRAAFAAGVQVGRRQMLEDSSRWVQLAPLLGSLLEELVNLREEQAVETEFIALGGEDDDH